MSLAADIEGQLLAWADAFEQGRLQDPAAGPDELFAVRIDDAVAADVAVQREGPEITAVLGRGALVATDRRLLVRGNDGPVFVWDWAVDVQRAAIARNGVGVLLLPSQARFDEGRRMMGALLGVLADQRTPSRIVTSRSTLLWIQVVGAWRASLGELDAWRAELPGLLGT